MFNAFIKLLAGTARREIPLVILILETGGLGLAALLGIGFLAAAVDSISPATRTRPPRSCGVYDVYYFEQVKEKRRSTPLAISNLPSLTNT